MKPDFDIQIALEGKQLLNRETFNDAMSTFIGAIKHHLQGGATLCTECELPCDSVVVKDGKTYCKAHA